MKDKIFGFIAVLFLISCVSAFAMGEQDSPANTSSSRYLFEENFAKNDIYRVDYNEFGETYWYVPNIGFSIGKRVVYDGKLPLLDKNIPDSALAVLNKEELRLLRNTIYAKHGMIFQSDDLKTHFQQFSWYNPRSNNVDGRLTEVDKNNIEDIQAFENTKPNPKLNKKDLVKTYLYTVPVPSWCPEIKINNDNTIEGNGGQEDNWKGTYRIENGFLVVLVTEQYVGEAVYFLSSNWRWPSGVTYRDGTVFYKNTIKMVFPVGDSVDFFHPYFLETVQRRQIGSIVWF